MAPREVLAVAMTAMAVLGLLSCGGPSATKDPRKGPNAGRDGRNYPVVIKPSPQCPSEMAFINPGPSASAEPKPVAAFCVDRYEGSLVEMTPDGEKPFSPYENIKEHVVRAISAPGVVPQGYISGNEAQAACRASKKRLCSEDEWTTACRGAQHTKFPYADARRPHHCNDDGKSPLITLYASLGVRAFADEPMNDPRLNQLPNTVARTGAFELCATSDGVFDMVGNLHEWTDDPAGTFRGGYYLDTHLNGDGCTYRTTRHETSYHDYSTGFRCCAEPHSGR